TSVLESEMSGPLIFSSPSRRERNGLASAESFASRVAFDACGPGSGRQDLVQPPARSARRVGNSRREAGPEHPDRDFGGREAERAAQYPVTRGEEPDELIGGTLLERSGPVVVDRERSDGHRVKSVTGPIEPEPD